MPFPLCVHPGGAQRRTGLRSERVQISPEKRTEGENLLHPRTELYQSRCVRRKAFTKEETQELTDFAGICEQPSC